eukprot:gene23633-biopygen20837
MWPGDGKWGARCGGNCGEAAPQAPQPGGGIEGKRENAALQAPSEEKKKGDEEIATPKALPVVGTSSGHTQRRPPFNCI